MQLQWHADPSELSPVYGWTCETREIRQAFIDANPSEIYWYYFPEEDDGWVKGPAWKIAATADALARQEEPTEDDDERW
jgi:hypothetical protein